MHKDEDTIDGVVHAGTETAAAVNEYDHHSYRRAFFHNFDIFFAHFFNLPYLPDFFFPRA